MKFLARPLRATLLLLALMAPAAVQAQHFHCTVDAWSGIIPPEFLIVYSGATATVTHGWIDGPAVRQVQVRGSGARSLLNFTIAEVQGFGAQRATLRFGLRHDRPSNAFRVTINPVEYANTVSAGGSCAPA